MCDSKAGEAGNCNTLCVDPTDQYSTSVEHELVHSEHTVQSATTTIDRDNKRGAELDEMFLGAAAGSPYIVFISTSGM